MFQSGRHAHGKGLFILGLCIVATALPLRAQILKFTSVDPSAFPVITSNVYPLDGNGHRLHPDSADIAITEGRYGRRVISISCPPDTVIPISSILTIDVSGSMNFGPGGDTTKPANMTSAKAAAHAWIRWLPFQVSECAVTSFDQDSYLNCDFTNDTATLGRAIDALQPQGGTDYNKAFLDPLTGALQISKNAKHSPIIVFLTDGLPNEPPAVDSILAEAGAQRCVIYAVTIGLEAPNVLYQICQATGGRCYSNVRSPDVAMSVYQDILLASGTLGPPCELTWESGPDCGSSRSADVRLIQENARGGVRFNVPQYAVAELLHAPSPMHVANKPPGIRFDTTIYLIAHNATFTIQSIRSSNPAYSIATDSLVIPAGDTVAITLSVVPPDSGYTWTEIDVIADPCPLTFYASGGYCGKPPTTRGLTVAFPNGGEDYYVNDAAGMRWRGMSPDDPVIVDYSIDAGKTWISISSQSSGWYAQWRASKIPSTKCLMRVQHFDGCAILQRDTSDYTWTISIPKIFANAINCGDAIVGTAKDTTIFGAVYNPGNDSVTIDSITFSGAMAGEFAIASAPFPLVIPAGQWMPIEFRFSPNAKGLRTANYTVHYGDSTATGVITGNGILPLFTFLTTGIDFGKVFVGEYRDTVNAPVVRYNGDKPVWIIDARIGTPNDTDFTILTAIPAHAMLNSDTMHVDLRFHASFKGRTSSRLIIRYDGPGSPLVIPLFGEGILPAGMIATTNAGPALTCTTQDIDSVRIASTGKNDLEIYSLEIAGVNARDFMPDPKFKRMVIAPGEFRWILIQFKPTGLGTRTATLAVHSNARTDSVMHVPLSGRKDSVGFSVDSLAFDIGRHCPGEPIDNGVIVTNNGTLPMTITATVAGGAPLRTTVQAGQRGTVNVDFTAPPYEGTFGADVNLADDACGETRSVHLSGISSQPHGMATSVFLDAAMGGSARGELTVTNTGSTSWTISSLGSIAPFVWINPPSLPITVAPNSPLHLAVGYTPDNTLPVSQQTTMLVEPCNVGISSQLTGKGGVAFASLAVRSSSANVGELVEIPIVLNSQSYLSQSYAQYFSVRLRYKALLLAPVGNTPPGFIEGNDRVIDVQIPVEPDANHVLSNLEFVATLCQDTITPLKLESASSDVGIVTMTTADGQFVLTGLCHAGGTRLVNPNGNIYLTAPHPNPSNEYSIVDVSTIETGRTQLYLVDMMGREVARMIDGEVPPGIATVQVPTRSLSNGMYELILQTPTTRERLAIGVTH